MDDYKRHVNFFKFGSAITLPLMKSKFNFTYEPLGQIEGPIFFLCNHNTDYDAIMTGIAAQRQMYYVATEKITRMGFLSKFLKYYFDPILHYKGKQGIATTKAILKHIKKGHSVAMFPEGNRSFNGLTCPIPSGTAKLAKACGATLVTYRLRGGYFSTPRWGKNPRKGIIKGEIAGVYTHDMLAGLSDEEVDNIIQKDLFVDAYADQKENPIAYVGKDIAESIESMLCYCPKCKAIGQLKSLGNHITCDCGFSAEMDAYGFIHSEGKDYTITELDDIQRKAIEDLAKTDVSEYFFDNISLEIINKEHDVSDKKDVRLSINNIGISFGEIIVPFEAIEGIAINQKNLLMVHVKGEENHYECVGDEHFNALKYLYMVRQFIDSSNGIM